MTTLTAPTLAPIERRARLAAAVLAEGEYRRRLTRRYPDDRRNADAADALRRLAVHILALPDDDPDVADLATLALDTDDGAALFGPGVRRLISRFGFAPSDHPEDFIGTLIAPVVEELAWALRAAGLLGLPAVAATLRDQADRLHDHEAAAMLRDLAAIPTDAGTTPPTGEDRP